MIKMLGVQGKANDDMKEEVRKASPDSKTALSVPNDPKDEEPKIPIQTTEHTDKGTNKITDSKLPLLNPSDSVQVLS